MLMSVREARANFAAAIEAAEKGERVVITRNGKPVAELGPPQEIPKEGFWERNARVRRELGLDKRDSDCAFDDEWLEWFNSPAWTVELFSPEYADDAPGDA